MGQPLLKAEMAEAVLGSEYFRARKASRIDVVESSRRANSTVFQVRVQLDPKPRLFWIKIYPANSIGNGEAEYRFLKLAGETFDAVTELTLANAVAYLSEWDAFVTEDLEGVQLHRLVKKKLNRFRAPFANFADIERHFQRCGSWLAMLHAETLPNGDQFDPVMVRDYVDVRLAQLEAGGAIDRPFHGRVLAYLDSLLASLEPEALVRVRTHGDYVPYNVIVTPERLGVLDPDTGGYFARLNNYCSRYEDIVRFFRYTRVMSRGMIAPRICRRLATSFVNSYAAASGIEVGEASAAFRAFRLKYELLARISMGGQSFLKSLTMRHSSIRAFRAWFDQTCRG